MSHTSTSQLDSNTKKRKEPGDTLPTSNNSPTRKNSITETSHEVIRKPQVCTGQDGRSPNRIISYIEFYSGIGGWTMALHEALSRLSQSLSMGTTQQQQTLGGETAAAAYTLQRLAALDHSDLCNRVFQHNFGSLLNSDSSATILQTPIERLLSVKQMNDWAADMWLMSPPCQPHTRQHTNQQQELSDPRSSSFLHICELLETMHAESLPRYIFLENVVGFETSQSCRHWREVLQKRNYHVGHFHLSPPQVGLPNDRPRYFCVAVRMRRTTRDDDKAEATTESTTTATLANLSQYLVQETSLSWHQNEDKLPSSVLTPAPPKIWNSIPDLGVPKLDSTGYRGKIDTATTSSSSDNVVVVEPIGSFLDDHADRSKTTTAKNETTSLQVPATILNKTASWCFDVVCPKDCRSACFTQSYGRFIRGTGSILYEVHGNSSTGNNGNDDDNDRNKNDSIILPMLQSPENREYQSDWAKDLDTTKLRYFSGSELARLFGFSKDFHFPSDVLDKQQWKMMGNSLNVRVAARLVELGLRVSPP